MNRDPMKEFFTLVRPESFNIIRPANQLRLQVRK